MLFACTAHHHHTASSTLAGRAGKEEDRLNNGGGVKNFEPWDQQGLGTRAIGKVVSDQGERTNFQ